MKNNNYWMINKFIKKHWLKLSIILFTCFIIIPVILNVFKRQEGFVDPLLNINNTPISSSSTDAQLNKNILDIYNIDTDLSNNVYRTLQSIADMTKLNTSLENIYGIDMDLSNNVYRKSDSVTDISNNFYDKTGNNLLNTILSQLSGLTSKIDDMNNKKDEEPTEDIKCIADFGTNIGDNLCCGQSGVLTDTKYVCPANYSKCESMKCGSKYGTCVKA